MKLKKALLVVLVGIAAQAYACTMEIVNDTAQAQYKGHISVAPHQSWLQRLLSSTRIRSNRSHVYAEKRLLQGYDGQDDKIIWLKAGPKMYRVQMIRCFTPRADGQAPQKVYLSQVERMARGEDVHDPDQDSIDSGVRMNDYLTVSVQE